ncbi:MAG: 2Fe-2S iron-sulfur cluster-binding protein [Acidovorax sp.]|uniref:2Fe-2S iron-sulfur cluster-binding protein n=1 Tax=Acidovorax sp. TaxID=1872122 RepID=UPI0039E31FC1
MQVLIDGMPVQIAPGHTVAAALALRPPGCSRTSVSGERRAPFCGMGICHECRVLVDGRRRLACQTLCADGMAIDTRTHPAGDPP